MPCGSLSLKFYCKETVVEELHLIVVRECAYPMLLGRNFLRRARSIENCGTGECQCSSESMSAQTSTHFTNYTVDDLMRV